MSFSGWFSKTNATEVVTSSEEKNKDTTETEQKERMDTLEKEISALKYRNEIDRTTLLERISELESEQKKDRVQLQTLLQHQVVLYHDGSLYQGELQNNIPHGAGTIFHANGYRYVGEWKNGLYDGNGTLYRDWFSLPFHGEFKEHVAHGKGTYDGVLYDTYVHGEKQ